MKNKIVVVLLLAACLFYFQPNKIAAFENLAVGSELELDDRVSVDQAADMTNQTLEAKVIKVTAENNEGLTDNKTDDETNNQNFQTQTLQLEITKGSMLGQIINTQANELAKNYQVGDKVLVNYSKDFNGQDIFIISDHIRRGSLLLLFIIFLILVVIIAKKKGLLSLLGMAISFAVIFFVVLPQIAAGANPIMVAMMAALLIIPSSFYLSHGLNKKTSAAIAGTSVAFIITTLLADAFIKAAKLTGFASEEAGFLLIEQGDKINIKGLLLAGIIIGVLGVLDDITISQSAIVFQLKKNSSKLNLKQLYKQAMNIGQDHIASMVNTLILVYAGASLPLLLLFTNSDRSFAEIINHEIVANEVVRTLVSSIGLIVAVPITTLFASIISDIKFTNSKTKKGKL